ncbi:MAG: hypothetical protein AB7T38_12655 [Nitrospirales bacterium]
MNASIHPLASAFTTLAPFGVVAPDTRVEPYTLLNLLAGYIYWMDRAEVAVSVLNALNDKHREHPLGDTIKNRHSAVSHFDIKEHNDLRFMTTS